MVLAVCVLTNDGNDLGWGDNIAGSDGGRLCESEESKEGRGDVYRESSAHGENL